MGDLDGKEGLDRVTTRMCHLDRDFVVSTIPSSSRPKRRDLRSTALLLVGMATCFSFPFFGHIAEYGGRIVAVTGVTIAVVRVRPKTAVLAHPREWTDEGAKADTHAAER
jgi:hypothetical protein